MAAFEALHCHTQALSSVCAVGGSLYTSSEGCAKRWKNAAHKSASEDRIFARGEPPVISVSGAHDQPDEVVFTAGHRDECYAKQWRISDGKLLLTLEHPGKITAMCAYDGYFPVPGYMYYVPKRRPALFTSCDDGRVRMWPIQATDAVGGKQSCRSSREFGGPAYGRVNALVCSDVPGEWANIPSLFTGCEDSHVRQYHLKGGSCVRLFSGHKAGVRCLSVEKRRLVSGSADKTVRVWDIKRGTNLQTLIGHTEAITAVCIVGWVFSASLDGTIRHWDPENGAALRTIPVAAGAITSLCSDGQIVYAGSKGGTCQRYSVAKLVVDSSIEVWWGGDMQWYPATIRKYKPHTGKFELVYDDGEREDLTLPSIEVRMATGLDPKKGPRGEVTQPNKPMVGRSKRNPARKAAAAAAAAMEAFEPGPPQPGPPMYADQFDMDDGSEELSTVKTISKDPELPEGWSVEERKRTNANSKTVKRVDKYYISPEGRMFRSKLEVMRHLEAEGQPTTPGLKRSAESEIDPEMQQGQHKKIKLNPESEGGWGQMSPDGLDTPGTIASFEDLGSALLGEITAQEPGLKIKVDGKVSKKKKLADLEADRTPTLSGRQPKTPTHLLRDDSD